MRVSLQLGPYPLIVAPGDAGEPHAAATPPNLGPAHILAFTSPTQLHTRKPQGRVMSPDAAEKLFAGCVAPVPGTFGLGADFTAATAERHFSDQVANFATAGAQLTWIHSMDDIDQIQAAVRGSRLVAPDLPILATLTFGPNFTAQWGITPAEAVGELVNMGVHAVGANGGHGPAHMQQIIAQMAAALPQGLLLMAVPNAHDCLPPGREPQQHCAGPSTAVMSAEDFAVQAESLHALGAHIVGAGQDANPAHTQALAARYA